MGQNLLPSKLRVVDLRKELKKRNLATTGLKAILVSRLQQALESEQECKNIIQDGSFDDLINASPNKENEHILINIKSGSISIDEVDNSVSYSEYLGTKRLADEAMIRTHTAKLESNLRLQLQQAKEELTRYAHSVENNLA